MSHHHDSMPDSDARMTRSLLDRLWPEVFQAERSAERHPLIEAERLGEWPPGVPMRLVSAHATNALAQAHVLAEARGVDGKALGKSFGESFSLLRDNAADLLLDLETSYRGTLLGIRHGIDVLRLLRHAAEGDTELQRWADDWLDERVRLCAAVQDQLAWFAAHPAIALAPVADSTLARMAKVVTKSA